MRAGNVRHGEAGDGGVEIEEGFVSHDRGYLGAEAAGLEILVDDEAAAGAADGVQNHLAVPRHQGAEVDDICRNALRRVLAPRDHRAPGDDGDLVPLPRLLRPAEGEDVIVARIGAAGPGVVEHGAMLEEHDRIIRSEEHTSELQSLMRRSYAVLRLKKKTNNHYTKLDTTE